MKKQIISIITALALCLSLCPTWTFAVEGEPNTGLCAHHSAHTADCGYTAPTEGHPCGHTHTAACYTNGQLPGGADYETGPDAQELLNCSHVHDADCGFLEPNGGSDCGFVCKVCPIEALIAALPPEVTPDNAGDVRAQLDQILVLFAALDEDEQKQVDVSRCTELQAALDAANVAAPAEVIMELDLSSKTTDSGSGYTWTATRENENDVTSPITSGTLTLDGFQATKVIIPNATVTIHTTGECTIGELCVQSPDKVKFFFTGQGSLTVTNRIEISNGDYNALTVENGATLIAERGIAMGASGGVNSTVTVKGILIAKSYMDEQFNAPVAAISVGRVTVGDTGHLTVSGPSGMQLNGMPREETTQYSNLFAFDGNGNGCFTASCSAYNIMVTSAAGTFPEGTTAETAIVITEEYMPYDCKQYLHDGVIDLWKISENAVYTGAITIHKKHEFLDKWESDDQAHWHKCKFEGCGKKDQYADHTLEWEKDETNHWQKCTVCGYETSHVQHNWVSDTNNSVKCRDCQYAKNISVTISGIPQTLTYGNIGTVIPKYTTNPEQKFITEKWELSSNTVSLGEGGSFPANLPAGDYTLTFTGTRSDDITLQGSTTFKVNPAPLTAASVTAENRTYDGTNTVNITNVELTGKVNGDNVSVDTANLTGTLSGSDAGVYTSVTLPTLTLTGAAVSNYTLTQPTGAVPTAVTISKASAPTPKSGNLGIVNNRAHTYTYGLDALLPDISADKSLGSISYELDPIINLGRYYITGAKINGQMLTLPIEEVDTTDEKEIGIITVTIHTDNYEDMTATIHVWSVNKKLPVGKPILTPAALTCGEPLSTIKLSGSMKDDETDEDVPGAFAWVDPTSCPRAQEAYQAGWTFTPNDSDTYEIARGTASIKVCKIKPDVRPTLSKDTLHCGEELSTIKLTNDSNIPGVFAWNEPNRSFDTPGEQSALCTFTPDNKDIYEIVSDITVKITVQSTDKIIPTGQPVLTPSALTYGEALSVIKLSGSMKNNETDADVPGAFAWDTPAFCPDAQEAYPAKWTFTPEDTSKYISAGGTSNIKVLPLSIEGAEIKLNTDVFPYDTKPHKPEITSVTLNGISLTADVDYTADIPEGRAPGTYTVTLTGKGNYTGTAETKFSVVLSFDQKDSAGDPLVKVETKKDEFDITEDLKEKGITESDKIKSELRIKIEWVDSDVAAKIEFYDVELQYKDENGNWHKVGPENFPEGGLTVFLPYPPNTGPTGFDFEIWHMITTGGDAGKVEPIACTPTADGLKCKFTSLSPVAIAYRAASPTPTPTPSGGGGGGSSSRMYPVKTEQPDHGSITAVPANASPGTTITITVDPDSGYRLDTLIVTDAGGKSVKLTAHPNGTYNFLMPNAAVTVTASFTSGEPEETCPWDKDCPSLKFSDLGGIGTWYHEAVDYVLLNALMSGYGNGAFGPNDNVTRAQFAQILYNRAGHPAVTGTSGFIDVLPSAWYAPAVTWAAGQNVVLGYGNGMFGPDDSITREQLAAMLWRYAGRPVATGKELHFADADKASRYAVEALRWAVDNGIINGKGGGILDPQGLATRAQVAQILKNLLEKQNLI